jgi:hypothetical protein
VRTVATSELEFLRNYKDALMHFNMLDRNMAYCLRSASGLSGPEMDCAKFMRYPYDKKLGKVKALIQSKGLMEKCGEFLALAERCRLLRNRIVHGHWDFFEHSDKPVRFHVPMPFEEGGSLTIDEFKHLVAVFAQKNLLFTDLREKHAIEY